MLAAGKVKKIFFILYLAAIHLLAGFFVYERIVERRERETARSQSENVNPVVPLPTPVAVPYDENNLPPTPAPTASPTTETTAPNAPNTSSYENQTAPDKLMIPVVGIKSDDLQDTFTAARSDNRVHNAIDIMAPVGAPVVAAGDGEIVKFFDSKLGGITIYQLSADKKYIYYYAHLQKRADNLQEKTFVKRGTVIGYVGDTGNAGAGNYHLHFSVSIADDPARYWDGTNINPYPLLKSGIDAAAE